MDNKSIIQPDFSVFAVYDRVAGRYGEPWLVNRDELAIRRFDYLMANSPMVANDCELYKLGVYDCIKGEFNVHSPEFVVKYEPKRSEVYKNG